MPRRYSMADLIERCKQRCDLENHGVIDDPEWGSLISEAYGELYSIVFESGLSYFEYATNLTTDGTNVLDEVTDHLSTVTLAYLVTASPAKYRDLRELMAQERSLYSGQTGSSAQYFALVDDTIYLYPTPPSGQVYQLRYVPQPPELTDLTADTVDVVTPDGLAFLVWSVAVKAMAKTEADARLAITERETTRARFAESVQMRAVNSPRRAFIDNGESDWPRNDGDWERWRW